MSIAIPSASPIASMNPASEVIDFDSIVVSIKTLDVVDLSKILKIVVLEMEKKVKNVKPTKSTKKKGSMPTGIVPPQLRKPRAWVDFTLAHAQENGWEPFTVHQSKKDKETGEKIEEEIEMPASIELNGRHIFPDSVDEKNPQGKTIIHKDAMSLSKQRWTPKTQEGTHQELYETFLAQYEEEEPEEKSSVSEKMTELAEKKRLKEEEAAEKKRLKEEEKAAKAAEKEAEKAAKAATKKTPTKKQVIVANE